MECAIAYVKRIGGRLLSLGKVFGQQEALHVPPVSPVDVYQELLFPCIVETRDGFLAAQKPQLAFGRLFEVTPDPDYETVWEYISPYYQEEENFNMVYRAYRVPYEYVPQLGARSEEAIIPPDNKKLRLRDLGTIK